MEPATFARLLTPPGRRVLAAAEQLHAEGLDPVRAGERLRRSADPELAAVAMTQATLRLKAVDKLGEDARGMFFTPDGLEQATRHEVSAHRAARISFAAPASVVDLGCGIGSDLVALARSGAVTGTLVAGVDLDPLRVAVARANLEALRLPGAVREADATALDLSRFAVVFADPARRTAAGRVFDVDAYAPPWSFVVEQVLTRPSCVKVAPGIPHDRVPREVEAEWVSVRGEVKEAALWAPPLATTERRATVIRTGGGLATLTSQDDPGAGTGPVGRFLHEPDGAVIRAGLVTAVAARTDGWLVDEHIAYVCSDTAARSAYARTYEVLEELPYQHKQLRSALRARGVGRLTIKKRGVAVVPEQLRSRLALKGDEEATLVLTRVAGRGAALLVRPLGGPAGSSAEPETA